jgi:pimeloyl-ACP methyl ester carboxylesterase
MTDGTLTQPTTQSVVVPGATVTYDVRPGDGKTGQPPLMLIGSPMAASGFGQLIALLPDRTIVTYDPRGTERSQKTDGTIEVTREQHADDIHAVIQAVGGPVDLFASSGGAVNALALIARYPNDVRTLVAHEPPNATLLPDREAAMAAMRALGDTYQRSGFGAGMAQFIALTSIKGPIPANFAGQPAPDPAMFGMPTQDDGSRDDALLAQNLRTTVEYEPDFDALEAAPTRIVLAAGEASEGQFAYRGAVAIAERLGTKPVIFPGGHGGFNRSEWDPTSDPEAFAAKLREVLAGD